jgi:thioredoxin-like negative regulator of GroEL
MLLDRQRVRFWQKWIFGIMALLMASFLIFGYSGVLTSCRNKQPSGQVSNAADNKALQDLKNQLKANPKDYSVIEQLATLYATRASGDVQDSPAQKADYTTAASYYQQYLKVRAKEKGAVAERAREQVMQQLGTIYGDVGDFGKAKAVYVQLTELKPKNPDNFLALGETAISAQDTTTALLAFTRYLQLAPNSPDAQAIRAWIKQQTAPQSTPRPSGSASP